MPLKELISDNGSEFGAHRKNGKKEWESRFKRHLDSLGIKLITSKIKHPQTNGKIEKLFDCYNMTSFTGTTTSDSMKALTPNTISKHQKTLSGAGCR